MAMSAEPERPALPCNCKASDAWLCAVASNRTDVVACGCACHRQQNNPERPIATSPLPDVAQKSAEPWNAHLREISGIDGGSAEAGARDRIAQIGYAEAERRMTSQNAEIARLKAEAAEWKRMFLYSEDWRKAYQDGKYALYAHENEVVREAAAKHLPCNEGPLDRFTIHTYQGLNADLRAQLAAATDMLDQWRTQAATIAAGQQTEMERYKAEADAATARAERAERDLAQEERAHLGTIGTRDMHEESLNEIFCALGMDEAESTWSSANDPSAIAVERAGELLDERDRIAAELSAAKTDTERLDWFEQWAAPLFKRGRLVLLEDGVRLWEAKWSGRGADSWRSAIDAARAKEPK